MTRFSRLFQKPKPVIAMVHLGALPGSPLYDAAAGLEGLLSAARADLMALQAAGVDAYIRCATAHEHVNFLQIFALR